MSKVVEVMRTVTEWPGEPADVLKKMVAFGWEVIDETDAEGTILKHDLMPGTIRIIQP